MGIPFRPATRMHETTSPVAKEPARSSRAKPNGEVGARAFFAGVFCCCCCRVCHLLRAPLRPTHVGRWWDTNGCLAEAEDSSTARKGGRSCSKSNVCLAPASPEPTKKKSGLVMASESDQSSQAERLPTVLSRKSLWQQQ